MIKNQISLDISQYNSKEKLNEIDCGWYDLETIKIFRDEFCKKIIPVIKINNRGNDNNPNINLAVNIFFKWFSSSLFELFAAVQTKKYLEKNYEEIHTPEKYDFLKKILEDKIPETKFQNLKNPYLQQSKFEKFFKNLYRTLQLNTISDFINFKKKKDVILFTEFLLKNIKGNGNLNVYRDLSFYFKNEKNNEFPFFDHDNNKLSKENLNQFDLIKNIIQNSFEKLDIKLSKNNLKYIDNLIYHCHLFLNYNWIKKNIPKELHVGTAGSLAWGKLLCAIVIMNGGKVINYEHGRGTILHFFIQKFFTDLNFSTQFININKEHMLMNKKRYDNLKKFYLLHDFEVDISQPKNNIKNPFSMNKKVFEKITREKLKALYVTGAYLGYSASFRPFLPDIHYLKFQTQVFDYLNEKKIDFRLKPHPGNKSKIPSGLIDYYKLNIHNEKYEEIVDKLDFDFFILDHLASTTAPHILNYSKPTIYFDFNFTEINSSLKMQFDNSLSIIPVKQNNKGIFEFNSELFNKFLDNIRHNNHINWNRDITKFYD